MDDEDTGSASGRNQLKLGIVSLDIDLTTHDHFIASTSLPYLITINCLSAGQDSSRSAECHPFPSPEPEEATIHPEWSIYSVAWRVVVDLACHQPHSPAQWRYVLQ